MTLGEQLTIAMKRQKITRGELAKLANMQIVTLRKVLNDNPDCVLVSYQRVAEALGVQIKYTVE